MISGGVCFEEHLQILIAISLLLIQEIPGFVEASYGRLLMELGKIFLLLRHGRGF